MTESAAEEGRRMTESAAGSYVRSMILPFACVRGM